MSDATIDQAELAAPERHLFLSPHYDDIALSCGGTAALLSRQRRTPEVALIFGDFPDPAAPLTAFAESLHREWGLSAAEVIPGRRAEEAAASALLGAVDRYLPFQDAIYRGVNYLDDEMLFGVPSPAEASLPDAIIAALELPAEDRARTRVYAPLAIGRHVDHQQAFLAGKRLAARGWSVWFYEDLPYALKPGAREDRLAAVGGDLAVAALAAVDDVWTTKIDAIMAYPSQLRTVFGYVDARGDRGAIDEVMARYARQIGETGAGRASERFWRVERGAGKLA